MSASRQQEYESKAKQGLSVYADKIKRSSDVYPDVATPYDWQWMFGFLGARAVTGIETVTSDYYERSFACDGHQGYFA